MLEFVSEPITPVAGSFDAEAMSRGEPGLPGGFQWRGEVFTVVGMLGKWKDTSAEGARAGGDVYLRRHCYELRMSDGAKWNVYFTRQNPRSGSHKIRWYLYTRETDTPEV